MSKTTDAVAIIDSLIGNDEEMQQMVFEASLNAKVATALNQKLKLDLIPAGK